MRRLANRIDREIRWKQTGQGNRRGRRYERHWTPVHVDFHVDDFEAFLAKAVNAGGKCEQKFEGGPRPPVAFCSDPFGNGFCVLGTSS
ncbi:MAG: VOC family protein [Caulobacterales bacterium]